MKKFILISLLLGLVLGTTGVYAQTPTKLKESTYTVEYTGETDVDTLGTSATTWSKAYQLQKKMGVKYYAQVKVSDRTADATDTIIVQGKYFAADSYTSIDTVVWYGGGTDTTVVFDGTSAYNYNRYLNFLIKKGANSSNVDFVKLSLKQ